MTPNSSAVAGLSRVPFGVVSLLGLGMAAKGWSLTGHEPEWGNIVMALGLGIAVLFALPVFAKPDTRLGLLMSLLLLGIGSFAFNAVLVFQEPKHVQILREVEAEREKQPGFDPRSPLRAATEMSTEAAPTYPYLVGLFSRRVWTPGKLAPIGGISTSTTVLCNEPGPFVTYVSDEYGFRNPRNLPAQNDVVLLGDSFAHGECVFEGQHTADVMRAEGISVWSAGASGSGPLLELAQFREYAKRRRPKVVVWFFYEDNDRHDLLEELRSPLLLNYLDDPSFSQGLADRQPEIDAFWKDYLSGLEKDPRDAPVESNLRELASLYKLRALLGLERRRYTPWLRDFAQILKTVRDELAAQGGRLHFVYLPGWYRFNGTAPLDKDEVLEQVRALDIGITDFSLALEATGDPLDHFPYRLLGHYNAKGHRLLAETVIEEAGLDHLSSAHLSAPSAARAAGR